MPETEGLFQKVFTDKFIEELKDKQIYLYLATLMFGKKGLLAVLGFLRYKAYQETGR